MQLGSSRLFAFVLIPLSLILSNHLYCLPVLDVKTSSRDYLLKDSRLSTHWAWSMGGWCQVGAYRWEVPIVAAIHLISSKLLLLFRSEGLFLCRECLIALFLLLEDLELLSFGNLYFIWVDNRYFAFTRVLDRPFLFSSCMLSFIRVRSWFLTFGHEPWRLTSFLPINRRLPFSFRWE